MDDPIVLGEDLYGQPLHLNPRDRRLNLHIVGPPDQGKSKLIEHIIRQDIMNGTGVFYIDPHGYSFDALVRWATALEIDRYRPLILIEPGNPHWTFGFNPLSFPWSIEQSYCVDSMIRALEVVCEEEDAQVKFLKERGLRSSFHPLAEQGLTLLEAEILADPNDVTGIRQYVIKNTKHEATARDWTHWRTKEGQRECELVCMAVQNRLRRLLDADLLRTMLGQSEQVMDFRSLMEQEAAVLVNLAPMGHFSPEASRVLGALILNSLFLSARERDEDNTPFHVYIDECTDYLTSDIAKIMTGGRKFGLHLTLAHQNLAQLRAAGDEVYTAVMDNARLKVVFGGLGPKDALEMAEHLWMGRLDLEEPKESLIRPLAVGQKIISLEGGSEGEAESEEYFRSRGKSEDGERKVEQTVRGGGKSKTRNLSESWREALATEYRELPTSLYSLDDQRYRQAAALRLLPKREAVFYAPGIEPTMFRTAEVRDRFACQELTAEFRERQFEAAPFIRPRAEATQRIAERKSELIQAARIRPPQEEDTWETV